MLRPDVDTFDVNLVATKVDEEVLSRAKVQCDAQDLKDKDSSKKKRKSG